LYIFAKCFQWYVASVLKIIFYSFHMYVAASVLSGCCICFIHMLQVFILDVAYVSHTCYKCFIWMLHIFICCNNMFQMFHLWPTYVASKCFMLQVFTRARWVMGARPGCQGMGHSRARDRRTGASYVTVHPDARNGECSIEGRVHMRVGARRMETNSAGVRTCTSVRMLATPITKRYHLLRGICTRERGRSRNPCLKSDSKVSWDSFGSVV
jgi:hypothetical protein